MGQRGSDPAVTEGFGVHPTGNKPSMEMELAQMGPADSEGKNIIQAIRKTLKNLSEITQISSKNASRPPKTTWECSDSLSWSGATSPHCTTSPGSCLPHQQLGRGRKLRAELWSSSSLKHVPLLGALPGAVGHGSHSSARPGVYYFFFPLYCAESPLFPACLSPQG